jgi:hypothetical protein
MQQDCLAMKWDAEAKAVVQKKRQESAKAMAVHKRPVHHQ